PTIVLDVPTRLRRASRYTLPRRVATAALFALYTMPSAMRLARLARQVGADLLHSNGLKAHVLAGLAGRLLRRPVVWHFRDFPPSGIVGKLFRVGARSLPALVFAVSEAVATDIRSRVYRAGSVVRLYDPVDLRSE